MNEVKEYKSSAYSCYRCGRNKFSFEHLTNGRMDVTCDSCKMTVSNIEKNKPFGNPIANVIICDPDGTVSKGDDKCSILITGLGDMDKVKGVLSVNSPLDAEVDIAVPYLCNAEFDPLRCLTVMGELRDAGCQVMKFNPKAADRASIENKRRELLNKQTELHRIEFSISNQKHVEAEERRKTLLRVEEERAKIEAQAEAKLVSIKKKFGKKIKEVTAELAVRKQCGEDGDGSRFEDID